MIFRDRQNAGALLALRLEKYRAQQPIVLGLVRGGVLVAFEVARALEAPLDVIVVRKLGAPGCPEYALGAIAEENAVFVSREALREADLDVEAISELAEAEWAEVARRVRRYRGDRPFPDVEGRVVILVDDGVATGATARAAARAARKRGAARVVLAAPVIAAASAPELAQDFDDIVAVEFPPAFLAVGYWYERFGQVSDEEVLECLRRASRALERGPGGPREEEPPGSASADSPALEEEHLLIPFSGGDLAATLALPDSPRGLVLFIHGTGSSRNSPRNRFVAGTLQRAGFATLLFDLLTPEEAAAEEEQANALRFDVALLAERVRAATRWAGAWPSTRGLPLAYLGSSTGAAAALEAAAELPREVAAVVSRGGRPDLVPAALLERVRAPVLLIVGRRDAEVLEANRAAAEHLARAQLAVVPNARHLFEEPGALDAVARLAAEWLTKHLAPEPPAQHA
jgi:putative phosphoribosyl transferase